MNAIDTITNKNGDLLPSKTISSSVKAPVLEIVKVKEVEVIEEELDNSSDDSDDSDDSDEKFYVDMYLTCTKVDNDEEREEKSALFNFGSEDIYMEYADNGFVEIESYFDNAITANYSGWTYADEWEENKIHGNSFPKDHKGAIIDIN